MGDISAGGIFAPAPTRILRCSKIERKRQEHQKARRQPGFLLVLASPRGFEPRLSPKGRCPRPLDDGDIWRIRSDRTPDPLVRSQILYPTELRMRNRSLPQATYAANGLQRRASSNKSLALTCFHTGNPHSMARSGFTVLFGMEGRCNLLLTPGISCCVPFSTKTGRVTTGSETDQLYSR